MKKFVSVILSLLMVLSMTACGSSASDAPAASAAPAAATEPEAPGDFKLSLDELKFGRNYTGE